MLTKAYPWLADPYLPIDMSHSSLPFSTVRPSRSRFARPIWGSNCLNQWLRAPWPVASDLSGLPPKKSDALKLIKRCHLCARSGDMMETQWELIWINGNITNLRWYLGLYEHVTWGISSQNSQFLGDLMVTDIYNPLECGSYPPFSDKAFNTLFHSLDNTTWQMLLSIKILWQMQSEGTEEYGNQHMFKR